MTVFQRRLAGLWPWLLMAALQVVFGQTGLELAAAVESERSASKAVIKVTLWKQDPGKPITLEGVFAGASMRGSAEGKLMQSHPLSLCNTSEDDRQETVFISIVKLESPERNVPQCLPLLDKARLALKRGAQAVIFDVSDNAAAAQELQTAEDLPKPVVLVQAETAKVLMDLVNKNEGATVHIDVMVEPPKWPHYDVSILLTVVLAVLAIVMIFAFRYRCKSNRDWDSVHQQTMRAIERLETRAYTTAGCSSSQLLRGGRDSGNSSNSGPICSICLEEFMDGQNLRIISCAHEFHKECVDPWLLQHRTCPLCMYNIMGNVLCPGTETAARQPLQNRVPPNTQRNQGFLPPRPNSGLHVFQQHSVPFALRHYYPEVPARQFPLPSHFGSPPSVDPQMIHCLPNRPLGAESTLCAYRLPEQQLSGPYRTSANCRSAGHLSLAYPRRPPCHRYRHNCPVPRATSNLRLNMAGEGTGRPRAKGQQDDGSCSGGSYRTERSGYFPDGPASDSSSGPCHGSSSDSALNFTDVSLQGMYGSCSTFRSSLSSDYDPLVYYGPGPHRRECLDADSRPHSLDSMNRGCPEEPLFSHVHCHHQRRPHCSNVDHSLGPDWASDEEQSGIPHLSTDSYPPTRHCSDPEPLDRLPSQREELKLINPSQSSFVLPPPPTEAPPPAPPPFHCCHQGPSGHHRRKKSGCVLDAPAVHFHQSMGPQENCSIHIHYGQGAAYCCSPDVPPLLPVPLILDSGVVSDWPCCGGHVVWQNSVQKAHSEPQLQGPRACLDRPQCRSHQPGAQFTADTCLYCQSLHKNQVTEVNQETCHEYPSEQLPPHPQAVSLQHINSLAHKDQ